MLLTTAEQVSVGAVRRRITPNAVTSAWLPPRVGRGSPDRDCSAGDEGHCHPLAVFSQSVAQSSHDGVRDVELGRVGFR